VLRSIDAFLTYFDAVHRRAVRDIGALPPEADGWRPSSGAGEAAWSVNQIVGHMAAPRLYFVSSYRGEGWIAPAPPDVSSRERWVLALEESARDVRRLLERTPDAWLDRKVPMIDTEGALSGWRILAMMVEHDVHHRSQLDTYAGLNGWPVPDIFGRSAERIAALQTEQRRKHGR
jgi:uncharacterized damage-inducible protein DinB